MAWFRTSSYEVEPLGCSDQKRLVAIDAKSQVGSFDNNFNNRTEEAIGSAVDVRTACRKRALPLRAATVSWLLEDGPKSQSLVRLAKPLCTIFPELIGASFCRRCELFCRKLVLGRQYTAATFITAKEKESRRGAFATPTEDLSVGQFANILAGYMSFSA